MVEEICMLERTRHRHIIQGNRDGQRQWPTDDMPSSQTRQAPSQRTCILPLAHYVRFGQQSVIVNFGKHKGKDFSELDGGYLHYLVEKDFPKHIKALCAQLKTIKDQKIPNASLAVALWAKDNL